MAPTLQETGQLDLFGRPPPPRVAPARVSEELRALGVQLPPLVHLGTSSWSYPGWAGLVYEREYGDTALARDGLGAYGQHPLFRTVGIDRSYYAPMDARTFRGFAEQVPQSFRFLAKAHDHCTLARFPVHPRYGSVRGQANPHFLDPAYARDAVVQPFVEGLGVRAGPLVFEFAPQDPLHLGGPERFAERLYHFLVRLPRGVLYGVELRNAELLTPLYGRALRATGAVHVVNAWSRMPPPLQQATQVDLGAGPALVVRWMMQRGGNYEELEARYSPFHRLAEEDLVNRREIAALVLEATGRGQPSYVVVSNKAEGCAPESVARLARAILGRA